MQTLTHPRVITSSLWAILFRCTGGHVKGPSGALLAMGEMSPNLQNWPAASTPRTHLHAGRPLQSPLLERSPGFAPSPLGDLGVARDRGQSAVVEGLGGDGAGRN
jgi:hypothetical protein